MPHCLFVGKAEYFRPLILPLADGLDPAAEYFCKIRRIVSYKGKYSRREIADLQIKNQRQPVVDEHNLKHERRSAHQIDVRPRRLTEQTDFGNTYHSKKHSERKRQHDGKNKYLGGNAKTAEHIRQYTKNVIHKSLFKNFIPMQ